MGQGTGRLCRFGSGIHRKLGNIQSGDRKFCTGTGKFIELQGTAEREPFSRDEMSEMLDLAEKGINRLFEIQRAALGG